MAEDQGVNGDRWTEQASALLKKLGWQKVADSNIDIPGADGLLHGIDAMFRYDDDVSKATQGIFVEGKRYSTSTFRPGKIQSWIDALNKKIIELRRSSDFNKTHDTMSETDPRNGLLVLWFHDIANYNNFKPTLTKALADVKTPRGSGQINRLFVISNNDILKLCSLHSAIESWNKRYTNEPSGELQFYYPSPNYSSVSRRNSVLNLEYMFSKLIFAVGNEKDNRNAYVVFYFGRMDIHSLRNLRDALRLYNIPADNKCSLYLYYYQRDTEFRKIEPDVQILFSESVVKFEITSMDVLQDLPAWMHDAQ